MSRSQVRQLLIGRAVNNGDIVTTYVRSSTFTYKCHVSSLGVAKNNMYFNEKKQCFCSVTNENENLHQNVVREAKGTSEYHANVSGRTIDDNYYAGQCGLNIGDLPRFDGQPKTEEVWNDFAESCVSNAHMKFDVSYYVYVVQLFSRKAVTKLSLWQKLHQAATSNGLLDLPQSNVSSKKETVLISSSTVFPPHESAINVSPFLFDTTVPSLLAHIENCLSILDSYAAVRFRPESFLQSTCKLISDNLTSLSIKQISTLVRSLTLLQHRAIPLFLNLGEILIEDINMWDPVNVINFLYSHALLGIKDLNVLRFCARYLHMFLAKGKMTPWEKTKLSRTYALLRFEHITFFKHLAHEIMVENNIMERQRYAAKSKTIGRGNSENSSGQANSKLVKGVIQTNNNFSNNNLGICEDDVTEFLDFKYEQGYGKYANFVEGGRKVDIMPIVWKYNQRPIYDTEEITCRVDNGKDQLTDLGNMLESELITNEEQIEDSSCFTTGHIAIVIDSMIYLGFHRWVKYFSKLSEILIDRLRYSNTINKLDPLQLTGCMVFFSNYAHDKNYESIVKDLTIRMVKLFTMDIATPTEISLFLKELVIYIGEKKTMKNKRQKTLRWKEYKKLNWLHNEYHLNSKHNLMQIFCEHLCSKVYMFSLTQLAMSIRAVAYLGFEEESFYKVFINYFKDRINELKCSDIANITQAFNKQKIKDPHLFYLMGKQFQTLQQNNFTIKGRKTILQRIG